MAVIFFNIGWMINYNGIDSKDITFGNHKYLKNNDFGYECYNFRPYKGRCYAYVPIAEGKSIHIERLGASAEDDFIDQTDIVMFARNPSDGKAYIVGWYRNATLYRYPQKFPDSRRTVAGTGVHYCAVCHENDAHLVPLDERDFMLQSSRTMLGGFGQSTIWYADKQPSIIKKVIKYISGEPYTPARKKKQTGKPQGGGHNLDIEVRLKIEKVAVLKTTKFFERLKYTVESVEKYGYGWDLTAIKTDSELFIEVKGTQGDVPAFELTPNEYKNLKKYRNKYRISSVTKCLDDNPQIEIFSLVKNSSGKIEGYSEFGTIIKLEERIGACCKLK